MDGLIMVTDMVADFKEQRDGKLADGCGSVSWDIDNRNSFFSCIIVINDIVTSGKDCDQADVRAFINRCPGDRSFIGDKDLSIADPLCDQW